MNFSEKNVLKNIDNLKVSPNEYLVKYTFWRNLEKLIENDISLQGLYDDISGGLSIGMYVNGRKYGFGEVVWYLYKSKKMVVLLRCMYDENDTNPQHGGLTFEENGWETLSLDVDIYTTDIMDRMNILVYQSFYQHQNRLHPHGAITEEGLANTFLKVDLSNANSKRPQFFYPYTTGFLPTESDGSGTIVNGSYRYYDNGLLEYDIIYRFGNPRQITRDGNKFQAITCNDVKFQKQYENDRYFFNIASYKMFFSENDQMSQMGNVLNTNRNDFVNTYFAKIELPISFLDTKYMIFSGDTLSQDNNLGLGKVNIGKNAVTFCDKLPGSITAILVTYPDGDNWDNAGYNAQHGGLAFNSYRCKLVGRASSRHE